MWKINHLVSGAGIQTHKLSHLSLLPLPLVQGYNANIITSTNNFLIPCFKTNQSKIDWR